MPFFVSRIRPVRGDPRFPRHRLALLVFQQLIALILQNPIRIFHIHAPGTEELRCLRQAAGKIHQHLRPRIASLDHGDAVARRGYRDQTRRGPILKAVLMQHPGAEEYGRPVPRESNCVIYNYYGDSRCGRKGLAWFSDSAVPDPRMGGPLLPCVRMP